METEKEYIKSLLLERFDYPSTEIDATTEQIISMSEMGRSLFDAFCETGILPDASRAGLSLREMSRQAPKQSPIALIIIFDGLLTAIDKLKR